MLIAHLDAPVAPAELWRSWNPDVLLVLSLVAALVLHTRGRRGGSRRWRERAFVGAVLTIAAALVSPLDALSSSLASAHMAQHLLLTAVAAPLLVVSAPIPTLLRGLPRSVRVAVRGLRPPAPRHAVGWALLFTVVLWGWHASALYEPALSNDLVHRLEHVTFLVTAVLSWTAILAPAGAGIGVLVLFGLSMQSGLLGALMTFAGEPWYPSYAGRTEAWGLSPLADQHLAGVIMWVPGGGAYLVAALALLTSLIAADGRSRQVGVT